MTSIMRKHGPLLTKTRQAIVLLSATVVLMGQPLTARSQSVLKSDASSGVVSSDRAVLPDLPYVPPTQRTEVNNYIFDAFGPYPVVGAGLTAGIGQLSNSPPEWGQGAEGYSKRFASDFGIAAVSTTTRYGLSELFREDALYYRCECRGLIPRFGHAILSTFTARSKQDGHRVFSAPALIGPFAGSMTAIYGWYPNRFGAKDALRTGSYSLGVYMGGNIALEFFYSGPHSLLSRMHLNNAHGSPLQGPNR